ncbi:hypothetical protein L917_01439 [Phytophthora nicotianae]|uniref:HTH psq-type domain-containing protein n=4 Tax=Phytophthora nicotianae TaxID=4792 RepID=W2LZF5_PHYNI|nr:hypothetical protein L917_01439 [Phytophthora nicotianae]
MTPQRSYPISKKRHTISKAEELGVRPAVMELNIHRRTLRDCIDNKENTDTFNGHHTSKTLKNQGVKSIITFGHDLITFMKDVRREEEAS